MGHTTVEPKILNLPMETTVIDALMLEYFDITNNQKLTIMELLDSGLEVSCDNISLLEYWNPNWPACPLCGARKINGKVKHRGAH